MDYNALCVLERRIKEAALLRQIIDNRKGGDQVYVKIGLVRGGAHVTLLRGIDGILGEVEAYLNIMCDALKKEGYTGDLSEVVLD